MSRTRPAAVAATSATRSVLRTLRRTLAAAAAPQCNLRRIAAPYKNRGFKLRQVAADCGEQQSATAVRAKCPQLFPRRLILDCGNIRHQAVILPVYKNSIDCNKPNVQTFPSRADNPSQESATMCEFTLEDNAALGYFVRRFTLPKRRGCNPAVCARSTHGRLSGSTYCAGRQACAIVQRARRSR